MRPYSTSNSSWIAFGFIVIEIGAVAPTGVKATVVS